MPNKVLTEEEVVSEIQDGMTIGVGGWGSRESLCHLFVPLFVRGEGPDHCELWRARNWASCSDRPVA